MLVRLFREPFRKRRAREYGVGDGPRQARGPQSRLEAVAHVVDDDGDDRRAMIG